MFIDYVRECLDKISFAPQDTFDYCPTEAYKECPFFKVIHNMGHRCKYIGKCSIFKYFGVGDFKKFIEITGKYCLSENNVRCQRFEIRETGKEAPEDLLPDGAKLTKK